ncbi:MAG: EamA family transporter [Niabella sp.]
MAIFITNIIFGLNMPISRSLIPTELDPFALNGLRILGAAALFWCASFFVKGTKMKGRDLLLLLAASFFGVGLNQISFLEGLSTTSPVTASLITTLSPIFTMILSALFLREPITWMKTIGIIVGACGAAMLILQNYNPNAPNNLQGILLILISVLSYALYLTMFKKLISRYHPVQIMKWMFSFSVIYALPFYYKPLTEINFATMQPDVLYRIGFVVLFATFIAYLLIPIGQKTIRPTTLSMYNYLQPVVASLVAVFVGMDKFGYKNILSALLVFSGVYIVTQSKTRYQAELEKRRKNILRIKKSRVDFQ